MATEKLSGTPTENPYGASNTDSYAEAITKQYADAVKAQNGAVDQNVSLGQEALSSVNQRGQNALNDMSGVAAQDYKDMKTVESGIEQNNGNRQQIGQSQYGIAENSYDQQRASIEAARAQLEKDVARQVADLKAQGEYAKADAALQAAQQRFQQLYADALRVDTNLRSNYEYQTGLQREDAAIQREQDNSDTAWLRKMGEALMAKGVTPPDNMLAAMGIDSSAAQQYINKIVGVYSGYVGGGGGGGGRPSGSQSGSPSDDTPVGTPTPTPTKTPTTQTNSTGYTGGKAYSNAVASQVYSLAASGSWSKAQSVLGEAYAAGQFSPQNYQTVYNMAQKKYFNYVNSKYKNRS